LGPFITQTTRFSQTGKIHNQNNRKNYERQMLIDAELRHGKAYTISSGSTIPFAMVGHGVAKQIRHLTGAR